MWKKFTDLLFEDDDTYEEEIFEEVEVQKPAVKPITITEQKAEPVTPPPPVFKEVVKEEPVAEPKPKPSISMAIDDLQATKPKEQEPVTQSRQRPRVVPVAKTEPKSTYEFTPVISPIFGISEKDVDAVIPTNPKKKSVTDSKVGTVISPMYGLNRDARPDSISGKISPKPSSVDEIEAEQEVPKFSLDEILARRDVEKDNEKTKFFKTSDLEDEENKTVVISSHNMSLFDDEE
ncbi:MAG: hypothetical protein WBH68_02015 [Erysipelotrichaceae bacterium]|nr:hypothetical protein [Bacillota bacterium]NLP22037.1 hypothetical protein [Erysipelotrichaceae bacterium]HCY06363.1 hypothetical protein [Erysipelotrichaceae bacterium]